MKQHPTAFRASKYAPFRLPEIAIRHIIEPAVELTVSINIYAAYFASYRVSETWDLERVDAQLKKAMTRAAQRVVAMAEERKLDLRCTAYATALDHISKVYELRGIFP